MSNRHPDLKGTQKFVGVRVLRLKRRDQKLSRDEIYFFVFGKKLREMILRIIGQKCVCVLVKGVLVV